MPHEIHQLDEIFFDMDDLYHAVTEGEDGTARALLARTRDKIDNAPLTDDQRKQLTEELESIQGEMEKPIDERFELEDHRRTSVWDRPSGFHM